LINEHSSLFAINQILGRQHTTYEPSTVISNLAKRILPSLTLNFRSKANYRSLLEMLVSRPEVTQRLLVVGARTLGEGMECLGESQRIDMLETDVVLDARVGLVCDGHDLPFKDGSMDCVVVQAVLEHVVDPARCVSEIHRVLKHDGLVYAETPFMQQVHAGPYDFMRFTPLGHRRLFRYFEEIASGSIGGPGVAMAWSYRYLLQGFATTRRGKEIAAVASRLTGFWLKYLDLFMIDRRGAQDGGSCTYFLGRKSNQPLTDVELLAGFPGIQ
jgi:SAM-dependent methyltransferase